MNDWRVEIDCLTVETANETFDSDRLAALTQKALQDLLTWQPLAPARFGSTEERVVSPVLLSPGADEMQTAQSLAEALHRALAG